MEPAPRSSQPPHLRASIIRALSPLLFVLLAAASCPPKPTLPTLLTSPTLPTPFCLSFPGGTPYRTTEITILGAPRSLRRSGSFIGACNVPRSFNWSTTPTVAGARVASYVDDCTTTDESSSLVTFNLSNVSAALAGLSSRACRIISAEASFEPITKSTIGLGANEAANCLGSVHVATNGDWSVIPAEDHRSQQFLTATSSILDTRAPMLPIHIPARPGDAPTPPAAWSIQKGIVSIDITNAVQMWIDRSTPNNGIVLFPQVALSALDGAKAAGANSAGCATDLRFVEAKVLVDVTP